MNDLAGPARAAVAIGAVANAATLAWAGLAVAVSGRGLGVGNEGFYLLAYEYWDRNRRTFTGAQYLYGPVFDVLGHDIAALRIVRLVLVLAVHLFFAIAFAGWLRLQRPGAPVTVAWEYGVASLVVASGAIVYGWLPPTPGYNDVTLLGAMVLVSLLLVGLRALALRGTLPWWTGAAWGFTAGAMVLAKPPVAVPVLLIAAVSAYAVRRAGGRLRLTIVAAAAGIGLFAIAVPVLVAPWGSIVPPLRGQLAVVSGTTHSPLDVVGWYVESSMTLLRAALVICVPTAVAALVARALRGTTGAPRTTLGLVGLAASLALLADVGGLRAGADNVLAFTSGIVAMLLIVIVPALREVRWRRIRGRDVRVTPAGLVLALLGLVPLLQGFGTNNALYAVAVGGTALWVALMIAVVTSRPLRSTTGSVVPATAVLLAVALAVVIGFGGLSHDGGKRALLHGPMAHVDGSDELSSIVLPRSDAAELSQLRRDLGIRPHSHRPMLALGELAHYVLVLGGRPIGEAWYSGSDDGLNAADLRAACRHGNPWGNDQPLVVADREPSTDELGAWRTCGIDFARDYADVTPPSAPAGVKILRWRRQPSAPAPARVGVRDSPASG